MTPRTCTACGVVMRPGDPLHFLTPEFCLVPAPDGFAQDHDWRERERERDGRTVRVEECARCGSIR